MNPKTHPKKRQSAKIKEFGEALAAEGFNTLDDQARVLGLSRSTTWTILRASHKTSGLSVKIIKRILAAPKLPPIVRARILEYIEEKTSGTYGGCQACRKKFAARLSDLRLTTGPEIDPSSSRRKRA